MFKSCLFAGACFMSTAALAAQPVNEEVHFASRDVAETKLAGWWSKAEGAGLHPTVVALHGCGGIYTSDRNRAPLTFAARHAAMGEILHDAGYNVLWIDSFGPRGAASICTQQYAGREITPKLRRSDVLGGLAWLASRPDVDGSRVALLGWSNGGSTVLETVDNLRREDGGLMPVGAVAFYPGCKNYAQRSQPSFAPGVPLTILIGAADDWTPAAPCEKLAADLEARKTPIGLHLYADSYHDFDAPNAPVKFRTDIRNGSKRGGVTAGTNPVAREAAYKEMLEFYAAVFAGKP